MSKKRIKKARDHGNASKRLDWEISRDRAIISELSYKNGLSNPKIADILNAREDVDYTLTPRMIGYELESILETWREGQGDADSWIDQEIMRLYGIEQSAWTAWEKSLEPKERHRTLDRSSSRGGDSTEVERLVEDQIGNPAYLKIVLDCVDRRARLRGLYVNKLQIQSQTEHHVKMYRVVSPADWDETASLPSGTAPKVIEGETGGR